ncbi:hypothetical protein DRW03_05465 [Corallococcus sp. H22C18031201]|uniref:hypothetical protein n=1 Tax=Citreicoccus inhibens TaxID=2849499 RepID=UPI000E736823|nr:hypothetical protein [Citreicoccus inhibens]MBU8896047.1 hypothetical protein [Citreicoccus inhibens]RJS25918.1 hypothetical protein DRW03_05465 [Corallococcus sp. H22C18031201]
MRTDSVKRAQWAKWVWVAASLAAVPAWADDAGMGMERPLPGALLVEVQPPALDDSLVGIRLELAPSREAPWAFGLVARTGGWSQFGAKARFIGTNSGDVKLNYALGAEGRYTLASFADGALQPFVGLTLGAEEFHARANANDLGSYTTALFAEPAVGAMWRPGAGRLGLSARVGPGFATTDVRELEVGNGSGTLKLRSVYPSASLSLLVVL